jgi:peptide/nickel transport system permease protein
MWRYVLARLLAGVVVVFLAGSLVFVMIRLVPGDILLMKLAESGTVSADQMDDLKVQMGLDKSVVSQYGTWLQGIARGDFGDSLWTDDPAGARLKQAIVPTLELAFLAMILATAWGIFVGTIAALKRNGWFDQVVRAVAVAGLALPDFWLATLLLLYLSIWLEYTPPIGYSPFWETPRANLELFIFPALVLAFRLAAVIARYTRSAVLEVLYSDYVRTAYAKGIARNTVVTRHVLRNALLPIASLIGVQLTFLLGGSVIMELIFSIPGVGSLTLEAVQHRDFIQLQTNVIFFATLVVLMNLLVDVIQLFADPRLRTR